MDMADKLSQSDVYLRGYWSLELDFLDKKLAEQGFYNTSQISHLVELSLRGWSRQSGPFLTAPQE
jgi:hypothetical protein